MSKCFVVLGQPRSGTSLAAGILHHLGIPMGEFINDPVEPRWDFAGGDDWNPKGLFEDAAFVNWSFAVMGWPWPDRDVSPSSEQAAELERVIQNRSRGCIDWGVKSAGLAYCLEVFLERCRDEVQVIRTKRETSRSIASWVARAQCDNAEASRIVTGVKRQVERARPDIELDFDDLENWPDILSQFTGHPITAAASEFPDVRLVRH